MPSPIYRPKRHDSPSVVLDKEKGIFEFSGRSIQEDADLFFRPIMQWMQDYVNNPNEQTLVTFNFEYINSASTKRIVRIVLMLNEIMEKGKAVEIHWFYEQDDELIAERGEEIMSTTKIPFIIKESPE